ncbi:cell cycle checkpoint protein, partial [Lecanoromycetidae sp. Uapishka_2]
MAPPAKRQRRLVVLSSGDEEQSPSPKSEADPIDFMRSRASSKSTYRNDTTTRPLPTRSRLKSSKENVKPQVSTAPRDPSTPPKNPTRKIKAAEKPPVSRPISTFFGAASRIQRHNGQPQLTDLEKETPELESVEDDMIEDEPSPVEDVVEPRGLQNTTRSVLDRRKRQLLPTQQADSMGQQERPPLGSQRFKIAGSGLDKGTGTELLVRATLGKPGLRPWAERYGPTNLEELAVHKKKVSDVRDWLENVMQGRDRKRILILKGPSGAGKTATISLLSKAMDFELIDWRNPVGSDFSSEGYSSMSAQFEDFLGRSGRFNALPFANGGDRGHIMPSTTAATKEDSLQGKVILLEEFPSTFLSSSSALHSFRSSVLEYLAVNTPSLASMLSRTSASRPHVTPIVIVITETRLSSSTAASDSFTAHRLLGSEILSHPGVSAIEFNPMASTLVTKALDLVVQKEARHSGRRRIPGPLVLKQLGEIGDVRSAIGSLEFLCLRAEDSDDWGGRVASRAKKGANASALTKMEKDSLELVTQRESSLGLFHAVGKVVYNKRNETTSSLQHPPDHLSEHVRLLVPQTSVDQLIDETGTDTTTFVAALHENYVLSCEGSSFTSTLNACLESLSDSDLLNSPRRARFGSSADYESRSFQGAAAEALRQDEICFHVAVRGLLFALPNPVKRQTHPVVGKVGGKHDAYKMFYPASMRLSRQMEETEGLVDRWADRLRAGNTSARKTISNARGIFADINSKNQTTSSRSFETTLNVPEGDEVEPVRTTLSCTKAELILERLPFVAKIEQGNAAPAHLNEIEKITQFHGINAPSDETSDNEIVDEMAPATRLAALQHAGHPGKEAETLMLPVEEEVEKLYLSEDDIED